MGLLLSLFERTDCSSRHVYECRAASQLVAARDPFHVNPGFLHGSLNYRGGMPPRH